MNEAEKQALIEWLRNEIKLIQSAQDEVPFGLDYDGEMALKGVKVALASLTAEPVCYGFCDGIFSTDGKISQNKSRHYCVPLFTNTPAAAQQWIKCSDKLPEPDEWVIGYTDYDGVIFHIKIGDDGRWMTNYQQWSGSTVTHWMPLPAPPEVT